MFLLCEDRIAVLWNYFYTNSQQCKKVFPFKIFNICHTSSSHHKATYMRIRRQKCLILLNYCHSIIGVVIPDWAFGYTASASIPTPASTIFGPASFAIFTAAPLLTIFISAATTLLFVPTSTSLTILVSFSVLVTITSTTANETDNFYEI